MKILILKPSSLGDVVQAVPVLRLLKRHRPATEIYWWLDARLRALLDDDPDLTGVVPFERRRWAAPRHWPKIWRSVLWMRAQAFDWVIDLQCLARSGAFAWLANGRLTVGLDEPREGARGFYDLVAPRRTFHTHAVDWYLDVLLLLGVPVHWHFDWLPARPQVAAAIRTKWRLEAAPWLVLLPGARWPSKRWPVEYFTALVQQLAARRPELRFAILGSEDDRPLGETIAGGTPQSCLNLAGQTSLPEMVEWIRLSALVVANDTGPMHVAAALGKPVVAMFGPTAPQRTGPYGQVDRTLHTTLPCVPCFRSRCACHKPLECLRALPPAFVAEHVCRRLESAA